MQDLVSQFFDRIMGLSLVLGLGLAGAGAGLFLGWRMG